VHLAALVVVPACIALGWWQVTRALDGNSLSWVYSVEWPFFAGYAIYMWWKLTHEEPGRRARGRRAARAGLEPVLAEAPAPTAATAAEAGPATAPATVAVGGAGAREPAAEAGEPGAGDDELDRYNRYLEALNTSGRRKRW